jgi:RHS repeat-associated protein
MPQWRVSEPYITLWLKDTPLLYRQSNGKWMKLRLSYKSTGDAQNGSASGFGDKWSCNWLGMLPVQTNADLITDLRAGGGQELFSVFGGISYKTGRTFEMASVASSDPPAIVLPSGAMNFYGHAVGTILTGTNYFLSRRYDRYGRLLQHFNYTDSGGYTLMNTAQDFDGRTNTLTYGDPGHPNLITAITDPYGHTAYFTYSGTLLTSIQDEQGMTTSFIYDGSENITSMITVYGTNNFQYFHGTDVTDSSPLARAILITEPTGDHQVYAYRDEAPSGASGAPCIGADPYGNYRLSYHWNRSQYQALSSSSKANLLAMDVADYGLGSVKHWLHADSTEPLTLSDTMDGSADPVDTTGNRPNGISYGYMGQDASLISDNHVGALKCVTAIIKCGRGQAMAISRNSLGRPTSYTYYNSASTATYNNYFDASGTILLHETGPNGELTRGYGYDPVITNLLVSVTNVVGDVLRYTHNTNLNVTGISFPGGLLRTNIYYTSGPNQGFLAQQIDIGFRTNSFAYTNGNLSIQTNELGLVTTYIYDKLSRLISTTYPDGTTISNIYNNLDIVAVKDRLNQWTYYGYNSVRQLMAVTNVNGQITTYSYCGCGSPDQITRWNGSTHLITTLSYDMGGRMTNAIYPDGYQLNYFYDDENRIHTVTDGSGNELDLDYVRYGLKNLIQEVHLGRQVLLTQQFDEYGRLTNSVDRNSVTTAQGYDFLNRLTTRQSFGNFSAQTGQEIFNYSPLGLTNYIDQLGHQTKYVRDLAGRVLYQTNANNELLQFTYNPADELLTLTDGKMQTTTWGYDVFGRVTTKLDALGTNLFIYGYDANDRLTSRVSAAKGTTTYKYDPIGNLTNVVYPISSNLVFRYDPLNRLTNMVDGVGSTVFGWTLGNQLASETGPWPNDALNYAYNSARQRSNLVLMQPNASPWVQGYGYDEVMRLTNVVSQAGTFIYSYSGGGDLVTMLNFGNNYIYNSYDGLARLYYSTLQVPSPFTSPAIGFQYEYDQGSERTQQVFVAAGYASTGNYINYAYDNIGQLKTAQGWEADNVTPRLHEQFGYAYDAAWNLNQRTNFALVQNFGVNKLNELTNATRSGTFTVAGTATEQEGSISGSPAGVTNVTVSGTGLSSGTANLYLDGSWARTNATLANGTSSYMAVALDTYGRTDTRSVTVNLPATNNYSYDSNGNLLSDGTRNFRYDDENQLTAVWVANSWSNNFAYDGLLRRRIEMDYGWNGSSWVKTNEVRFVYDGNLVIQERDANNLPLITYTRGNDLSGSLQVAGGIGGLLARTDMGKWIAGDWQASADYYFDGNGNVAGLVYTNGLLAAQYNYDPFGNILTMSGPLAGANIYRFSSKEWNNNAEIYYYGRRFYDPSLQRWLNRDPIQEVGGINLYAFVGNNPLTWIDYLGQKTVFVPPGWQGPPASGDTIVNCPNGPASLYQNMSTAESVGFNQPNYYIPGASSPLGQFVGQNLWFHDQVKTGGPWDYKDQPTPKAHPEYDPFGNFNYGAAGHAFGYDDWTLQNEAGIANGPGGQGEPGSRWSPGSGTPPYGDRPKDNQLIQEGIEYAKQYPVENGPGPCK